MSDNIPTGLTVPIKLLTDVAKERDDLKRQIEAVRKLPEQWKRAGSLMVDAQRCHDDLVEALGDK